MRHRAPSWVQVLEAVGPYLHYAAQVQNSPLSWVVGLSIFAAFALFFWSLAAGLSGLHQVPKWRAFLSLVVAMLAVGLIFGQLKPPGQYGLHCSLKLWEGGKYTGFGLSVVL